MQARLQQNIPNLSQNLDTLSLKELIELKQNLQENLKLQQAMAVMQDLSRKERKTAADQATFFAQKIDDIKRHPKMQAPKHHQMAASEKKQENANPALPEAKIAISNDELAKLVDCSRPDTLAETTQRIITAARSSTLAERAKYVTLLLRLVDKQIEFWALRDAEKALEMCLGLCENREQLECHRQALNALKDAQQCGYHNQFGELFAKVRTTSPQKFLGFMSPNHPLSILNQRIQKNGHLDIYKKTLSELHLSMARAYITLESDVSAKFTLDELASLNPDENTKKQVQDLRECISSLQSASLPNKEADEEKRERNDPLVMPEKAQEEPAKKISDLKQNLEEKLQIQQAIAAMQDFPKKERDAAAKEAASLTQQIAAVSQHLAMILQQQNQLAANAAVIAHQTATIRDDLTKLLDNVELDTLATTTQRILDTARASNFTNRSLFATLLLRLVDKQIQLWALHDAEKALEVCLGLCENSEQLKCHRQAQQSLKDAAQSNYRKDFEDVMVNLTTGGVRNFPDLPPYKGLTNLTQRIQKDGQFDIYKENLSTLHLAMAKAYLKLEAFDSAMNTLDELVALNPDKSVIIQIENLRNDICIFQQATLPSNEVDRVKLEKNTRTIHAALALAKEAASNKPGENSDWLKKEIAKNIDAVEVKEQHQPAPSNYTGPQTARNFMALEQLRKQQPQQQLRRPVDNGVREEEKKHSPSTAYTRD